MTYIEILSALGNIGEFIGAIAVVATLVYLAIQVRHSRAVVEANTEALLEQKRLSEAQSYQARSDATRFSDLTLADSPQMADLIVKRRTEGLESLSASEYLRYSSWHRSQWAYFDNLHYQYERGYLPQESLVTVKDNLRSWAPVWTELGLRGSRQAFQDLIDEALETNEEVDTVEAFWDRAFGTRRDT